MTLTQLIAAFRGLALDAITPYLNTDPSVIGWLNEAERRACVRARLIFDDSTAGVCEVAVVSGTSTYALHAALYEVSDLPRLVVPDQDVRRLKVVSRGWLEQNVRDWRDATDGEVSYLIQDDKKVRLVPPPQANGTLKLEGYRLPLNAMAVGSDTPEIAELHHDKLVQWALHRAYSVPDSELFDPVRSANALAEFTAYFGPEPDADLRRTTRHDQEHHNVAWFV